MPSKLNTRFLLKLIKIRNARRVFPWIRTYLLIELRINASLWIIKGCIYPMVFVWRRRYLLPKCSHAIHKTTLKIPGWAQNQPHLPFICGCIMVCMGDICMYTSNHMLVRPFLFIHIVDIMVRNIYMPYIFSHYTIHHPEDSKVISKSIQI